MNLIKILQNDFPIISKPFKAMAKASGIPESELLANIKDLKNCGTIRKFGAILKHQKAGFSSNAMVVFDVPDEKVDELGKKLSSFKEVSHCYERPRFPGFNYNLYAMTHGKSKGELMDSVKKISENIGIPGFNILWSIKEYKKSSPKFS
ncbi:Lrp/AsnC family transcriptional regulator [Candidatus Saganbacteria bacterium]|nr:Lrp/AsnC family transcriptional regulator [Candidatus Saganbacteria bacterium]